MTSHGPENPPRPIDEFTLGDASDDLPTDTLAGLVLSDLEPDDRMAGALPSGALPSEDLSLSSAASNTFGLKDETDRQNPGEQNPGEQNPGEQNPGEQNPGEQIRALLSEIDGLLQHSGSRWPWMGGQERERYRDTLEHLRGFLATKHQTWVKARLRGTAPFSPPQASPNLAPTRPTAIGSAKLRRIAPQHPAPGPTADNRALLQQVTADLSQDLSQLRQTIVAPLQAEIVALQQQRDGLSRQIRQLERRQQDLSPGLGSASLGTDPQMLREFLQAFMGQLQERLEDRLVQQVSQQLVRLAQPPGLFQPPPGQPSALPHTSSGGPSWSGLAPGEGLSLEQLQHLQQRVDQMVLSLDTTLRLFADTLERNLQGYHHSLGQSLEKMHNLGRHGEIVVQDLVGRLAGHVETQSNLFLQASIGDDLTALPEMALPGTALPGTALPGTAVPGTALPGTALPGTGQPGAARPNTDRLALVEGAPERLRLQGRGIPSNTPARVTEDLADSPAQEPSGRPAITDADLNLDGLDWDGLDWGTAGEPFWVEETPDLGEAPVGEIPVGEIPVGEIPVGEIPVGRIRNRQMIRYDEDAEGAEPGWEANYPLATTAPSLVETSVEAFYAEVLLRDAIAQDLDPEDVVSPDTHRRGITERLAPTVELMPLDRAGYAGLGDAGLRDAGLEEERFEDKSPEDVDLANLDWVGSDGVGSDGVGSDGVGSDGNPSTEEHFDPTARNRNPGINPGINSGINPGINPGVRRTRDAAPPETQSLDLSAAPDLSAGLDFDDLSPAAIARLAHAPALDPSEPTDLVPRTLTRHQPLAEILAPEQPIHSLFDLIQETEASPNIHLNGAQARSPRLPAPTLEPTVPPTAPGTLPATAPGTLPATAPATAPDTLPATAPATSPAASPSISPATAEPWTHLPLTLRPSHSPPEPTTLPVEKLRGWYLGLEMTASGLSAVLLNQLTGQCYPLYWVDAWAEPSGAESSWAESSWAESMEHAASPEMGGLGGVTWRLPAIAFWPRREGRWGQPIAASPQTKAPLGSDGVWLHQLPLALDVGLPYTPEPNWDQGVDPNPWYPRLAWPVQPISNRTQIPEAIALQTLLEGVQSLLQTLTGQSLSPWDCGAHGLPTHHLQQILTHLESVVVSTAAEATEAYRFNLREAVLAVGLVERPEQVAFVERAIAALLAEFHPLRNLHFPTLWQGGTLVIHAGDLSTELGLVCLPNALHHLNYEDFRLRSLPYGEQAFRQDVATQLLYPFIPPEQWMDSAAGLSPDWAPPVLPLAGEPDSAVRSQLQRQLTRSPLGLMLLEASDYLFQVLQRQERITFEFGSHACAFSQTALDTKVVQPFLLRLKRELNRLLNQSGMTTLDISQVLCTGEASTLPLILQWVQQMFPQAKVASELTEREAIAMELGEPLEERAGESGVSSSLRWRPPFSAVRVAYGLVTVPLYPQALDRQRQQYNDYFLLLELLRVLPMEPLPLREIWARLEKRGVNTQACGDRLEMILNGILPSGLVPEAREGWTVESMNLPDYRELRSHPLFIQPQPQVYQVVADQRQRLMAYWAQITAHTQQTLSEPYILQVGLSVANL